MRDLLPTAGLAGAGGMNLLGWPGNYCVHFPENHRLFTRYVM